MRIITLFTLLILFWVTKVNAYSELDFKRHTFELSVTPCFDYHFITWPNRDPGYKQQINNLYRSFIGGNLGVAYIYRPFRFIGFSTGFNIMEQGIKMGYISGDIINTSGGYVITTLRFKGYTFNGYISVPVLVHAYYQINKTELDLATGPEFIFPTFSTLKYSSASDSGGIQGSVHTTRTADATTMREDSWLSWTVQLSARVPIKNLFDLSIGPEMKFLTIYPLDPGHYYQMLSHEIDFYIGVKVGFRLGSNFYKKAGKTVGKS